jgi:hypothetical protein
MKTYTLLLAAALFLAVPFLVGTDAAEDRDDYEAVRAAVLDYIEGIYQVEPDRIRRSVAPDLAKLGYWRPADATTYQEGRMSFDQLVGVAETWNKDGRVDPATAPKEIEIYDVMDQTATVKLSAHWGVDYMHLAKIDGQWMIKNVLWQSYPPEGQ